MLKRFHIVLVCVTAMVAIPSVRADDVLRTPQSVQANWPGCCKDTVAFISVRPSSCSVTSGHGIACVPERGGRDEGVERHVTAGQPVLTKNKIMVDQPIGIGYWGTEADNDMPYVVVPRGRRIATDGDGQGQGRRLMFLEGTDWVAVSNAAAASLRCRQCTEAPHCGEHASRAVRHLLRSGGLAGFGHEQSINAQLKTQLKGSFNAFMDEAVISLIDDYPGFTLDLAVDAGDGELTFDARYEPTADSRFAISGTQSLVQLGHRCRTTRISIGDQHRLHDNRTRDHEATRDCSGGYGQAFRRALPMSRLISNQSKGRVVDRLSEYVSICRRSSGR